MDREPLEQLNKRIGVVIALLLRSLPRETKGPSLRDQVAILNDLGLRPREIAEILGRSPGYVSKELVGIRKDQAKKGREQPAIEEGSA